MVRAMKLRAHPEFLRVSRLCTRSSDAAMAEVARADNPRRSQHATDVMGLYAAAVRCAYGPAELRERDVDARRVFSAWRSFICGCRAPRR